MITCESLGTTIYFNHRMLCHACGVRTFEGRGLRSRTDISTVIAPALTTEEPEFRWSSPDTKLCGWGVAAVVEAAGPGYLADIADLSQEMLAGIDQDSPSGDLGPMVCGALPFDGRSPARLIIPQTTVRITDDGKTVVTRIFADDTAGPPPPEQLAGRAEAARRLSIRPLQDRAWWLDAVSQVLADIHHGRTTKALLSRQVAVSASRAWMRSRLFSYLEARSPDSYTYAAPAARDDYVIGTIPELLVERSGSRLRTRPLAGTTWPAGEGLDPSSALVRSAKLRREHDLVIDDVRAKLAPLSTNIHVRPTEVADLQYVAHLATTIEADLTTPYPTALTAVRHLHPTAAVGGLPAAAATELIRRLEPFVRGHYGGPVGWMDAQGDGQWTLAFRAAKISGSEALLGVGAGIVAGSDAAEEWQETEAKLQLILDALTNA